MTPRAEAAGPVSAPRAEGTRRTMERDRDVMRQGLTWMMVGLCLVGAPSAGADGPEAGGAEPTARARRLIESGDHVAAVTELEDVLLEARATDRPAILELLRQSYE